jgi:hypothetical protein
VAEPAAPALSRRGFLGALGGTAAATMAASATALPLSLLAPSPAAAQGPEDCGGGPAATALRDQRAFDLRVQAANLERNMLFFGHPCTGEENLYPNKIANYSKALPHNALGEVDLGAYQAMVNALRTGNPADFERIPLGGTVKLTNPQSGLAWEMEGPDSHHLTQPPPPAFASAEEAAEIAENYWMALTRDIPFAEYPGNPLVLQAAADLSRFSDFRGPKEGGRVTPATIFRAGFPGVLNGPSISQFLFKELPFGVQTISQRMRTTLPSVDYLTRYADWLAVQNGAATGPDSLDPTPRYIRSGRDIGQWVHIDVLFQAYFNAMPILLGSRAPVDPNNPYRTSRTQIGFGTLGDPYIASLVCAVPRCALKAVWFQKWLVHRRLRPEEFAGRIHNHVTGAAVYPIHADVLNSSALDVTAGRWGTFLLAQAFPEGCPTHPSYGAGHATVAGACVTVLKAFFDESFVLPNPVVASADGQSLLPYSGPPLTVGGELNKLASNIAMGRNMAGVHWRSDAIESMLLGEEVAIRFLREERMTFNEQFNGYSLSRFDGSFITI